MKKIFLRLFVAIFGVFLIFLLLDFAFPLNQNLLRKDESKFLYDKNGFLISAKLADDGIWRKNTTQIPATLKQSVIFFEDKYFYYHFGINPLAFVRAVFHNATHSRRIGGSTITMQVARMINRGERNYKNKIKEIFMAFQLEFHFTKDEILTMYFNLAPYGGNIEGVSMASRLYFDKDLNELSTAQMALLSVIPKNPNKNRLDKKSNINALKSRILRTLRDNGIIDESEYKRAKNENFTIKRHQIPNLAPHYSQIAFKNGITKANLDINLQNLLTNLLKKRIEMLKNRAVNNASGLIIDNEKMQVVAYVGSHDFRAVGGQNDGINSLRNVGSTLKPFIYANALDMGLISPKSSLIDTGLHFGAYAPQNYDKNFNGKISASEALNFSLNIPAVKLNNALGENGVYRTLQNAGLELEKAEFYGDSIALGGISLKMLDLAHLYTAFASGGALKPLEIGGEMINKNTTLMSEKSAWIVYDILASGYRAYLGSAWASANKPKFAFKTGTSARNADLYTIGFSKDYTIAVWLGNFNGKDTDRLSGIETSWHVVAQCFDELAKMGKVKEIAKPKNLEKSEVCTDIIWEPNCQNKAFDYTATALKRTCDFYKNEEIFFMLKNNLLDKNALKSSICADSFANFAPLITTPANKSKIIAINGENALVKLSCVAMNDDEVYLKINDKYKTIKNSEEIYHTFGLGAHKIGCLDKNANYSENEFEVVKFK